MKKFAAKTSAFLIAVIMIFSSCGGSHSAKSQKNHPFPMTNIPSYLGQGYEAYAYLAKNFWKPLIDSSKVFSSDTSLVAGLTKETFRNGCMEYAQIVSNVSLKDGLISQKRFVEGIIALERENPNNTLFHHAVDFAENVFYGANSDFRNEELYLPIAQALSEFELIDEATRGRYKVEVKNCSKNRLGEKATDFTFTTKEGRKSSLYKVKGDFTIIFFSNPGCTACKEIIDNLNQSLLIQKLFSEKRLNVINVYIDEDLTEWYNYMSIYPKEWINCFNEDLTIKNEELYDVRAIPSLYLLDKDKNTILKDTPLHILLNCLNVLSQE